MNEIKSPKDLVIGEEYFLTWVRDYKCRKVIFLGLIQEQNISPEIYFLELRGKKLYGTNIPYLQEIGIGCTCKEANANYGKFKGDINEIAHYSSQNEAIEASKHIIAKYP